MTSYLDLRKLSALTGFVNLILCLVMLYIYKTRKTYPGFSHWVCSAFLIFAGTMLLSQVVKSIEDFWLTIVKLPNGCGQEES